MLRDNSAVPAAETCAPPTALIGLLTRCRSAYYCALDLPVASYADQAERADALRAASERTAAAWTDLLQWMVSPGPTGHRPHWVYVSAARTAQRREQNNVRFWQETADFWHRRAAGMDLDEIDAERWPDLSGRWAS